MLSYIAINNSYISSEHIKELNRYFDNDFYNKWLNIYLSNVDLSVWIFDMWTDLMSKFSKSNLDSSISFRLLMLISGLKCYNKKENFIQGIINIYKPHIINNIFNNSHIINIIKWIILLLNDNISINFLNIISSNHNNIDFINLIDIDYEIKYIVLILYNYLNNYDIDNTTDFGKYFYLYNVKNINTIDILCKIILLKYDKLNNKPLKQTIIDTIFYLKNINIDNINSDEFKNISIINLDNNENFYEKYLNLYTNLAPSLYGYINYILDYYDYNNDINNLSFYHFSISHILGLYYEGLFNHINYNINDIYQLYNNNIILSFDNVKNNKINYHKLNNFKNNIDNNTIPLPLNYLILNNIDNINNNLNNMYYDITNRYYNIPSFISYILLLLKRINYYQKQINQVLNLCNIVIKDIITNNNNNNIIYIFTQYYPSIVAYTNILNYFYNSYQIIYNEYSEKMDKDILKIFTINPIIFKYKNLAELLNSFNSYNYIYNYLFTPENIIHLKNFNYYQIPIDNSISSYYFFKNNPSTIESNILNQKNGLINNYDIGNYNNIMISYYDYKYPTIIEISQNELVLLKDNKMPPALYNSLNIFYTYSIIEIVKYIILLIYENHDVLNSQEKYIYDNLSNLINNININIQDLELIKYNIISKLSYEIIKNNILFNIQNIINLLYDNIILNDNEINIKYDFYINNDYIKININNFQLSLDTIEIDLLSINDNNLINIYSIIDDIKQDNYLTIYTNDFSNTIKIKENIYIYINKKIIELLLKNNALPYLTNLENIPTIFPLIKYYNYDIINELLKYNIDFKNFDNKLLDYIINENLLIIDKVLYNIDINNTLISNILNNIDKHLYNEIKILLKSDNTFGYNILNNLDISFNIISYITFQYLSENLLNLNTNFTIDNLNYILDLFNFSIDNIYSNYLYNNLYKYDIPDNINNYIIIQLLEKYINEYELLNKEYINLNNTISTISNSIILNKIKISIKDIDIKKNKLNSIIIKLKSFNSHINKLSNIISYNDNIIKRYSNIKSINYSLLMYAWNKLINSNLNKNYNLLILYLLDIQKQIILNIKNNLDSELQNKFQNILITFKHLSFLCENYFNLPHYTNSNIILDFINNLINYITIITIGNNIELFIRRILFTYFINIYYDKNLTYINNIIEYILHSKLNGYKYSLIEYLYDYICPKFVKNSLNIFKDENEKEEHIKESIYEILDNYFNLLNYTIIKIDDDIIKICKNKMINYFDLIIEKLITLWYVNIENIFRYIINNYKCLQTLSYFI
jgi:hypothetical protein